MSAAVDALFCSWCGKPSIETDHTLCEMRLSSIDPPRYCAQCARRMIVQVHPSGWTAKCSRHGELSGDSSDA